MIENNNNVFSRAVTRSQFLVVSPLTSQMSGER